MSSAGDRKPPGQGPGYGWEKSGRPLISQKRLPASSQRQVWRSVRVRSLWVSLLITRISTVCCKPSAVALACLTS